MNSILKPSLTEVQAFATELRTQVQTLNNLVLRTPTGPLRETLTEIGIHLVGAVLITERACLEKGWPDRGAGFEYNVDYCDKNIAEWTKKGDSDRINWWVERRATLVQLADWNVDVIASKTPD